MKTIPKENYILAMSSNNKEAARATSGETVIFETYDCFTNKITLEKHKFSSVGWQHINPATGPLYVDGAEKGDTLKVEIIDIKISNRGVIATSPKMGILSDRLTEEKTKIISIENGMAKFNDQLSLEVSPMIGVIGTTPIGKEIPTGTPGVHGGNLDCKRIAIGSTIYLPVNVPGGLLAMGDAHAIMGDGEVAICGLEVPAEIRVKVTVIKGQDYPLPFLIDEKHIITIASAETLDEATKQASINMHEFLVNQLNMDVHEAALFLSVGAELNICQVVNPLKTSRMELPRSVLEDYHFKIK